MPCRENATRGVTAMANAVAIETEAESHTNMSAHGECGQKKDLCDLAAAQRGRHGERERAARSRLDHYHGRHLRPPHHRGRQSNFGSRGLVHRNRGPVVSTPAERPSPIWPGLLEKLMGVVRSEFRVDLYVPYPDHPVLGRGVCAGAGGDRSPTTGRRRLLGTSSSSRPRRSEAGSSMVTSGTSR
jgi:hypothetical protein